MSERTNRNLPTRNTLVQLLALYTDPESHNAQRYRQTVRQTDGMMVPIADACDLRMGGAIANPYDMI